jgi:cell division septation protein DedD
MRLNALTQVGARSKIALMVADYPSNIPPGDFPEKNFGQPAGTSKEHGLVGLLKNVLVFLVLVGVVAASFLVSFQLGRKILVPTKKGPAPIAVPVTETPASIKSLQKLQAMMSAETVGKDKKQTHLSPVSRAAKSKSQPGTKVRSVSPVRHAADGHYFKVQAGLFSGKTRAAALAEKLKAGGIDVFIRKTGSRWRVQAGAYKTRGQAEAMCSTLSQLGYQSTIVYE